MKVFTKTITMAVALAMTTGTSIFARDRDNRRPMQQDMKQMDQGHVMKDQQMMSGYNAPARYDVKGSWDVFFTADFLYWQTRLDNLQYGVGFISSTDAAGLVTADERVLNVDFGWHPGVKVGLGVNSDQDDWDIYVEWTHVVSHNNTRARVRDGGAILATQVFPDPAFSQQAVSGDGSRAWNSYRNIYNTVDLEMGRTYYVGKHLSFRPNVGVRGAWFRQSYNTQYDNLVSDLGAGTPLGTSRIHSKFNDWSLGPRFGIDTCWMIGQGFRLFGNTAFNIAWTSVSSRKRQNNDSAQLDFDTIVVRNNKGNGNLRPNADAELGFGWGSYFDNGNWHFDLALAYEFHYWWDHNFDIQYMSGDGPFGQFGDGNLALHGGTFRVRFDF